MALDAHVVFRQHRRRSRRGRHHMLIQAQNSTTKCPLRPRCSIHKRLFCNAHQVDFRICPMSGCQSLPTWATNLQMCSTPLHRIHSPGNPNGSNQGFSVYHSTGQEDFAAFRICFTDMVAEEQVFNRPAIMQPGGSGARPAMTCMTVITGSEQEMTDKIGRNDRL